MNYKKLYLLLVLTSLVTGCVRSLKSPLGTVVSSSPGAVDTFSNTPTPPLIPGTATATPFPPLKTTGPYLAYLRNQGGQSELVFVDADGKGQKSFPYPMGPTEQGSSTSLSKVLSPDGKSLAYYTGSAGGCFGNGEPGAANLALNLVSLPDGKSQVITKLLSQDYPNNFVKAAQELIRIYPYGGLPILFG